MAADFIKIQRDQSAATEANTLLNALRTQLQNYQQWTSIKAKMDHMFVASPADWTLLETVYGVPTGKGEAVYTLINGLVGAMENTFQNSNGRDITSQVG